MIEENIKNIVDNSPLADTVSELSEAVDAVVAKSVGAKDNLLNGVLPGEDHSEFDAVLDRKISQWEGLIKASIYMDAMREIQLRGGIAHDDISAKLEAEEAVTIGFFDFALKQAQNVNSSPRDLLDVDTNALTLFAAGPEAFNAALGEDPEHALSREDSFQAAQVADQVVTHISNGFVVRELAAELNRRLTLGDSPEIVSALEAPEVNRRLNAFLRVVDNADSADADMSGDSPDVV